MQDPSSSVVTLAIGRLLRVLSRPEESGDAAEYEHLRALILDAAPLVDDYAPNWARDRLSGAAGD